MLEKNKHGGYRPGSGRKTKYEKTVVMRIPEKYKDVIQGLISHLDETASLNHHYEDSVSKPMYLRSLKDNKQHITFITKPLK